MKGLRVLTVRILSVLSLMLCVFIIIITYLIKSALPCPDTKLKLTRIMVRDNELIGKNINICNDYFGQPKSVIVKDDDSYIKIYSAGHTYQKVMGMYDSEYFNIKVSYNSDDIITGAEICESKGG